MHLSARKFGTIIFAAALAMVVIVAACGGDDAPATAAPTMAPRAPTAAPATSAATPASTPTPAAAVDVGPNVGQVGADFTLTSVDGEEINLYSLRGSPVVLYYFATW